MDVSELPNLPDYFECYKIDEIDWEAGKVSLVIEHWHVAIMADGCRVNIAAGNILTGRYGLFSPTARCSVHAGDGSLKRMATSETMCVEEVKVFAGSIIVLLRHFQLSGKSSELLREALSNLELKELHMVTWCPTRMSYMLSASKLTVKNLVGISDVLASADIKEERSSIMTPEFMIILHCLADLDSIFGKHFLKALDTNDALIIKVYNISMQFAEKISTNFKTPLLDTFLDGLNEDQAGNIVSTMTTPNGSTHEIMLNYNHRHKRGQNLAKIDVIKGNAHELKQNHEKFE